MEVSLEPVRDLCARLGSPEKDLRVVHVAGSKGKGTTSALVAGALRAAGLRVALYTSPHVERVTERLLLDGREVEPSLLAAALERAWAAREEALAQGSPAAAATWFDLLTAAALLVIAESSSDLAVVECGLGGRLDSTNVVHGAVAAITNIYLEHTQVLGTTRTAIAREKAGIIKPGARVVVGALAARREGADDADREPEDDAAAALIERIARERGASCMRVQHADSDSIATRNLRLAAAILSELEQAEPALAARCGGFARHLAPRAEAELPGRAERTWVRDTRVVLDGAHVPESLELLLRDLQGDPELASPPVVVFGCGKEKNARGLLAALSGRTERVLCTSVGDGPARDATELADLARTLGLVAEARPTPSAALDEALRHSGTSRWVLVTGSLHLIGALRGLTRSKSR